MTRKDLYLTFETEQNELIFWRKNIPPIYAKDTTTVSLYIITIRKYDSIEGLV